MINFKIFLPGIILAATGVGAGDLITGGLTGVYTGTAFILTPIVGALFKYALNENMARFQLEKNQTIIYEIVHTNKIIKYIFFIYLIIWSYIVGSALINGSGSAASSFYLLGDSIQTSKLVWGIIHSLFALFILKFFKVKVFEFLMSILVSIMFVSIILCCLYLSIYSPEVKQTNLANIDFWKSFEWAIAVIGGVGGTLTIICYGYWIQDNLKSFKDKTHALKNIRLDLKMCYLLTGLFSICMIYLGSKVGNFEGSKALLPIYIGNYLGKELGLPIMKSIFLVGFWGGVYSSFIGLLQAIPFVFTDFFYSQDDKKTAVDQYQSTKHYKWYQMALATIPISGLFFKFVFVQKLYAIFGALFIPFLAFIIFNLNMKKYKSNNFYQNIILITIFVFFLLIGIRKLT